MKKKDSNSNNKSTNSKQDSSVDEQESLSHNHNSKSSSSLKELNLEETSEDMKKAKPILIIVSLVAIIAGSATGIGSYKLFNKSSQSAGTEQEDIQQVAGDSIKKGDVFGVHDEETFPNNAKGYLEAGGIDGEGSHKLLRPGGSSQTVYLTSSVTDLDKLVGMEIEVWGETYKGQQAGWLMDVGKVKVVNPEAEPPAGEEL